MSVKGYSKAEFRAKYPDINDFYHSEEWILIRSFVLQRDQFQCRLKGKKCTGMATIAHHVLSVPFNPEHCLDPAHIVAICELCHEEWNKTHKKKAELRSKVNREKEVDSLHQTKSLQCQYCGKPVYWNRAYFAQGKPQGMAPTLNPDGTKHRCKGK